MRRRRLESLAMFILLVSWSLCCSQQHETNPVITYEKDSGVSGEGDEISALKKDLRKLHTAVDQLAAEAKGHQASLDRVANEVEKIRNMIAKMNLPSQATEVDCESLPLEETISKFRNRLESRRKDFEAGARYGYEDYPIITRSTVISRRRAFSNALAKLEQVSNKDELREWVKIYSKLAGIK